MILYQILFLKFYLQIPYCQQQVRKYLKSSAKRHDLTKKIIIFLPPHLLLSWSILQDFHHDPSVLISDPALISLACIQLSLQTYGIAIPYADSPRPWHLVRILYRINIKSTLQLYIGMPTDIKKSFTLSYPQVFHPKATNEAIWDVMTKIMEIYTSEASLIHPICSISNSKKIK